MHSSQQADDSVLQKPKNPKIKPSASYTGKLLAAKFFKISMQNTARRGLFIHLNLNHSSHKQMINILYITYPNTKNPKTQNYCRVSQQIQEDEAIWRLWREHIRRQKDLKERIVLYYTARSQENHQNSPLHTLLHYIYNISDMPTSCNQFSVYLILSH